MTENGVFKKAIVPLIYFTKEGQKEPTILTDLLICQLKNIKKKIIKKKIITWSNKATLCRRFLILNFIFFAIVPFPEVKIDYYCYWWIAEEIKLK